MDQPPTLDDATPCATMTRVMVEIERARAEDVAELPAIESEAARRFEEWSLPAGALTENTSLDELATGQQAGTLWVARDGGRTVGFALVEEQAGREPLLDELDVLPSHGRRGIGRLLVFTVKRWAEDA